MTEREMADHAPDDGQIVEPISPDPALRQGRVHSWANWVVGVFVVCLVVFVLYALNAPGPEPQAGGAAQKSTTTAAPGPSATTGSGSK